MDADADADADVGAPSPPRPARAARSRRTSLAFLACGLLVAFYLGMQGPKEQHLRVVLGNAAPLVTGLEIRYLGPDGEVARQTQLAYPLGSAPRVVAHDPQLRNAEYRIQIEVDTRDGRRSVQRQVRLGGGSTQIDVANVVMPSDPAAASPSVLPVLSASPSDPK